MHFRQGEIVQVFNHDLWQSATYVSDNDDGTHKVRIGRSVMNTRTRNIWRTRRE